MCKYHMYLDVNPDTGTITFNHPNLEIWEMKESCSLDKADEGMQTLETIGELLDISRERARQLEMHGFAILRRIPRLKSRLLGE